MATAETANLLVRLSLQDNLSRPLKGATGSIGAVGTVAQSSLGKVGGAVSKAERGMIAFGGAMGHAKSQVAGLLSGPVGMIGLGAGLFGVAGALDATVNASRDFEAAMTRIHTQADASTAEVKTMSTALLDMAASVGTSPNDLALGLYHLESAGFRSATALNALKIAAEGAKIGHANLEDVTNALDAVLVAGGKDAINMSGSMGRLNAIVGAGDMKMQDLADALGTGILAAAHTFGLSLADVGGALATMGDNNIRGSEAATKLRMSISLMGAPSVAAAKALKTIGMSSVALNEDMQKPNGLIVALEDLKTHLDALTVPDLVKLSGQSLAFVTANVDTVRKAVQAQVLTHAFGGGKSSTTIQLLLEQLSRVEQKTAEINKLAGTFGAAWDATVQTAQFKWDKFNAALGATAVKVGNVLLPIITDAMGYLGNAISRHENDIVGFFKAAGGAARTVGTIVKDDVIPAVKLIGSAWMGLPSQLRDFLLVGFAANKVGNFLFGKSLVSGVAGGLKGLIEGVLGRIPGTSTVVGIADPGQRVFVTNWPLGGFGGGGIPPVVPGALAGAAEGIAAGAGGLTLGAAAALVVVPLAVAAVGLALAKATDPTGAKYLAGRAQTATARGVPDWNNKPLQELNRLRAPTTGGLSPEARQAHNDLVALHAAGIITAAATKNADSDIRRTGSATVHAIAAATASAAAKTARAATIAGLVTRQAIRDKNMSPSVTANTTVNVNVTASGIKRIMTFQRRYGPGTGSKYNTGSGLGPGGA